MLRNADDDERPFEDQIIEANVEANRDIAEADERQLNRFRMNARRNEFPDAPDYAKATTRRSKHRSTLIEDSAVADDHDDDESESSSEEGESEDGESEDGENEEEHNRKDNKAVNADPSVQPTELYRHVLFQSDEDSDENKAMPVRKKLKKFKGPRI